EGLRLLAGDRLHFADVVAGAERAAAAADQHHADVVHRGDALQRLLECGRQRTIEGIERVGAVEREAEHALGNWSELREAGLWRGWPAQEGFRLRRSQPVRPRPMPATAAVAPAARQKLVRKNGTWKNGEWRGGGVRGAAGRTPADRLAPPLSTPAAAFG